MIVAGWYLWRRAGFLGRVTGLLGLVGRQDPEKRVGSRRWLLMVLGRALWGWNVFFFG